MSKRPEIVLVVAMSRNRIIGRDNELPWHLPGDLKHFKALTQGKPVVMGRKTFDSIGRPLPKRTNIVLTRNTAFAHEGIHTVSTPEAAIALALEQGNPEEIMIIGGAQVYAQLLPMADRVELTLVDIEINGDAAFPALNADQWTLEEDRLGATASEENPAYRFQRYRKI